MTNRQHFFWAGFCPSGWALAEREQAKLPGDSRAAVSIQASCFQRTLRKPRACVPGLQLDGRLEETEPSYLRPLGSCVCRGPGVDTLLLRRAR